MNVVKYVSEYYPIVYDASLRSMRGKIKDQSIIITNLVCRERKDVEIEFEPEGIRKLLMSHPYVKERGRDNWPLSHS